MLFVPPSSWNSFCNSFVSFLPPSFFIHSGGRNKFPSFLGFWKYFKPYFFPFCKPQVEKCMHIDDVYIGNKERQKDDGKRQKKQQPLTLTTLFLNVRKQLTRKANRFSIIFDLYFSILCFVNILFFLTTIVIR